MPDRELLLARPSRVRVRKLIGHGTYPRWVTGESKQFLSAIWTDFKDVLTNSRGTVLAIVAP